MSTNTVLCCYLVLGVISLTAVTSELSQCISCPCGNTGRNFSQCFNDTLNDQHTCETWSNCQECAENQTFCLSCPLHRSGRTCSEVCGAIPQRSNRRPGARSRAGEWPWTMGIAAVSSEDAENVFCSGVILDKNTVLTAAQCVTGAPNTVLLFGTAYPLVTGDSGSEQKRRISRAILHPDFDNETKSNDIALLKFENPLNFSETIQPICLPVINSSEEILSSGKKGLVLGWGYNYTMYMFIPAVKYQEANVSVQPHSRCTENCERQGMPGCSSRKTLCVDYPKGVDACMYRGAPMVLQDEDTDRYTLAGLVTRKLTAKERNCRRGEVNTLLTNISHFLPFILQNLS